MYNKVIRLCGIFNGYTQYDTINVLRLEFRDISEKWEAFNSIFLTIYKWSSFRLILKDRPIVGPEIKKVFYSLQDLKYCMKSFDREFDKLEYCEGGSFWGCHRLTSVKVLPDFYTIDKGWYTFGHLDNGSWIIDKNEILTKLLREANENLIDNCPNFNKERIRRVVNALPDQLDIATKHWKLKTSLKFIDGQFKTICTGIHWQGAFAEFKPETFLKP
jgi:hypothetical protein